jgi:hypothetical protein
MARSPLADALGSRPAIQHGRHHQAPRLAGTPFVQSCAPQREHGSAGGIGTGSRSCAAIDDPWRTIRSLVPAGAT